MHQPGATCRSMASCRWLVEPGTTPSLVSPSHPPVVALSPSSSTPRAYFLLLLRDYPSERAFSLLLFHSLPPPTPRCEKTRRVSSRRVDPHKRGRAFLMRSIDCQHPSSPFDPPTLFRVTLRSLGPSFLRALLHYFYHSHVFTRFSLLNESISGCSGLYGTITCLYGNECC